MHNTAFSISFVFQSLVRNVYTDDPWRKRLSIFGNVGSVSSVNSHCYTARICLSLARYYSRKYFLNDKVHLKFMKVFEVENIFNDCACVVYKSYQSFKQIGLNKFVHLTFAIPSKYYNFHETHPHCAMKTARISMQIFKY